MSEAVLAIDLGGTKTLAALVRNGRCEDMRRGVTTPGVPTAALLDAAVALADGWSARYDRAAVAVSGLVAAGHWSAVNPAVLAVADGYPLVRELRGRLGVPVTALNDAQAAAWGEFRFGAGQGRDIAFVTVSTGVGGGLVSQGRLLVGGRGVAGHVGRFRLGPTLDAATLEDVASGGALGRAAGVPAELVFAAAADGAGWAVSLLDRAADALASGLASLQAIFDPDRIVLGGGVGLAPGFADRLRHRLSILPVSLRPTLVVAALGIEAGLIGVADYAELTVGETT